MPTSPILPGLITVRHGGQSSNLLPTLPTHLPLSATSPAGQRSSTSPAAVVDDSSNFDPADAGRRSITTFNPGSILVATTTTTTTTTTAAEVAGSSPGRAEPSGAPDAGLRYAHAYAYAELEAENASALALMLEFASTVPSAGASPNTTLSATFSATFSATSAAAPEPAFGPADDEEYRRKSYVITLLTAFAILSVIAVTTVTNLFAFVVFVTRANKRRSKNIYLANLAMVDMLIGLVAMPIRLTILVNPAWNLHGVHCRAFLTLLHALIYASLLGVVLVSVDRWYSICYPFTYRVRPTGRIAVWAITVSWAFSVALHVPAVALSDHIFHSPWPELVSGPCRVSPNQHSFTVILFTLVKFVLPHLTMLVLKISLYRKIRQRKLSNVRRSFGSFDSGALALIRTSISESAMNTLIEASNATHNGGSHCYNGLLSANPNSSSRKPSAGLTRRNTMELISMRQSVVSMRADGYRPSTSRSWSGSPDQRASLSVPVLGRRMSLQDFMMPSNLKGHAKPAGFFSGRGVNGRRETVGDLAKQLLDKQDSKAVWYLSLLLTVSLICWTPLTVVYVLDLHGPGPRWLGELAVWVLLVNSTANPFLYGLLNKEFRKVLLGWFRVRTSKMKRLQLALRLLSFQVALGAIDFQDGTNEEVDTSGGLSTCPEAKES